MNLIFTYQTAKYTLEKQADLKTKCIEIKGINYMFIPFLNKGKTPHI